MGPQLEHCWSIIHQSNPQVSRTHTLRSKPEHGLHSGKAVGTLFSKSIPPLECQGSTLRGQIRSEGSIWGRQLEHCSSNPTHTFRVSRTHTLEQRHTEQGFMPGRVIVGTLSSNEDRTLLQGRGCTLGNDHYPEQGSIQGRTVGTLSSNPETAVGTPSWIHGG